MDFGYSLVGSQVHAQSTELEGGGWAGRFVHLLLGNERVLWPLVLDLEGARFPPAKGRITKHWGLAPEGCLGGAAASP